ncbi:MAG: hypothetical protein A2Y62_13540 [Candidatus Fischerbacteria bacterium RBG_13_37_8]|uniref:Uncharacterized protein n=1 Tax=Candidatus Fischerbacteria bacterium RBG_13_37_8 TaxID=1817863 RepID=A0A1F5VXZ8_9BACT|nr:MAG: hypothetical protein A2Y62_13540 [Candidatus Fischerbacteria bacterium RBG_13_37_8]
MKKGFINYSSQDEMTAQTTIYETAVDGTKDSKEYYITHKMRTIDEIAHDVYNRLLTYDQEAETDYSIRFPKSKIKEIIKKSLDSINDKSGKVNETNFIHTIAAFGIIRRKGSKRLRLKIEAHDLIKIDTQDMPKHSLGVGSLRRDSTVFWDDYSLILSDAPDIKLLKELEEDESLLKSSLKKVENKYNFKTPTNVVLASYEPERKFIRGLIEEKNAKAIDAWIKAPDVGFYSIEYSWRKGEHPKQGSFNPDFFIKIGSDIMIVEIKMDDDISNENKAKLKYAREHFSKLNELQNEQKYYFKFLSPKSYDLFFKALRDESYHDFKSELEASIEEQFNGN